MTVHTPPVELLSWALSMLAPSAVGATPAVTVVAGDASNRRYFRVQLEGTSYILVDAPPSTEKNPAFLAVRELLANAGVQVPALYAADLERGYLVLGDLGDRLLLAELTADSVDAQYQRAMDVLLRMSAIDTREVALPAYDNTLLAEELGRFPAWFVEKLLGQSLNSQELQLLAAAFDVLVDNALQQPAVLVHRDFHSRNLMPQPDGSLGVIDFQDAVLGPVTYDLVSLLRDCYIQWPASQVQAWAIAYLARLQAAGHLPAGVDSEHFLRWFDLMGLQRHIKVLGTFARLYLRDGKSAYLDDLPLVIAYVREIAGHYGAAEPALGVFAEWFDRRLMPLISRRNWGAST